MGLKGRGEGCCWVAYSADAGVGGSVRFAKRRLWRRIRRRRGCMLRRMIRRCGRRRSAGLMMCLLERPGEGRVRERRWGIMEGI